MAFSRDGPSSFLVQATNITQAKAEDLFFLSSLRDFVIAHFYPGLAPWAALCCAFGARVPVIHAVILFLAFVSANGQRPTTNDWLQRAFPLRFRHIHRQDFQPMPLRVFYDGCRTVKTHRLIVQQGCSEGGKIMLLQVRAGIGDQGKARCVRFGKSVKCKRSD